jgi:hypothetical protein
VNVFSFIPFIAHYLVALTISTFRILLLMVSFSQPAVPSSVSSCGVAYLRIVPPSMVSMDIAIFSEGIAAISPLSEVPGNLPP